ncbi:MAG TPA: CsbD family protein [Candidatus Eisenbacteria bacterium]|nr:CsbD family protein [Candidatus Eisenbacteria bacterium]
MDREEIKGKVDKAKGEVKKEVGRATHNPRLEGEGDADKLTGEVREGVGKVRRKANDTLNDVNDAFEE